VPDIATATKSSDPCGPPHVTDNQSLSADDLRRIHTAPGRGKLDGDGELDKDALTGETEIVGVSEMLGVFEGVTDMDGVGVKEIVGETEFVGELLGDETNPDVITRSPVPDAATATNNSDPTGPPCTIETQLLSAADDRRVHVMPSTDVITRLPIPVYAATATKYLEPTGPPYAIEYQSILMGVVRLVHVIPSGEVITRSFDPV